MVDVCDDGKVADPRGREQREILCRVSEPMHARSSWTYAKLCLIRTAARAR